VIVYSIEYSIREQALPNKHNKINCNLLVSIIILNWNRKQDLEETLKALNLQTYRNIEVLIVDNCSTDGSQEMIENQFPDYWLINLPRNLGCEEGFNVGIVNAKGEILIFLDNDALLEDDGVKKIVEEFENDPTLGIIDPRILNYYTKQVTNEPKYWPTKNMFTGCAAGFRRELFQKIGLRPNEYFIYGSEPDICIRALDAGYNIKHCPDIVAFHKESPEKRLSPRFYYYSTRNVLWLIWKHYPVIPGIWETIIHLTINMKRSIQQRALHYYLMGVFEAFIKAPSLIRRQRDPLINWEIGRVYPSPRQIIEIIKMKYYDLR